MPETVGRKTGVRLKNAVSDMIFVSRAYLVTKPFYSGAGVILLFHRVRPKDDRKRISWNAGLEVTPEYLEGVIKFFKERDYAIISPDEMIETLRRKRPATKFVIFTFDDGYADNLAHAYPVFKRHQAPFTVYVTTGFADKKDIPWWYLLEGLMLENDSVIVESADQTCEFDCALADAKERVFRSIYSSVMADSGESQLSRIRRMFCRYDLERYDGRNRLMLDWDEIAALSRDDLVTIGAHTVNHLLLSNLSDSAAMREMLESKKALESRIGREVRHFSYPFGSSGQAGAREFDMAKRCGFLTAVTSRIGNIFPGHGRRLESLPRTTMAEEFGAKRLEFLTSGLTHCINNKFRKTTVL